MCVCVRCAVLWEALKTERIANDDSKQLKKQTCITDTKLEQHEYDLNQTNQQQTNEKENGDNNNTNYNRRNIKVVQINLIGSIAQRL